MGPSRDASRVVTFYETFLNEGYMDMYKIIQAPIERANEVFLQGRLK